MHLFNKVHPIDSLPTCHPCCAAQYKPITVVRFVIAGTIEERILKLQVWRNVGLCGVGEGCRRV